MINKDLYLFFNYFLLVIILLFNTSFQNDEEFASFIEIMKSRSSFDYGVEVSSKDHILTLSTCTFNGEQRVVLHAKRLE